MFFVHLFANHSTASSVGKVKIVKVADEGRKVVL